MRHLPLTRCAALLLGLAFAATAGAKSTSKIDELGNNTYAVTRTATTGFDRDVEKFKQEAKADAEKFCADRGKALKIVAYTSERPHVGGGYASGRLVFKALDAGDPELTAPAAPAVAATPAVGAPAGVLPTYAGDLYAELLKLDDLRKRGLLTDKEFEQEKKKLLKRSK